MSLDFIQFNASTSSAVLTQTLSLQIVMMKTITSKTWKWLTSKHRRLVIQQGSSKSRPCKILHLMRLLHPKRCFPFSRLSSKKWSTRDFSIIRFSTFKAVKTVRKLSVAHSKMTYSISKLKLVSYRCVYKILIVMSRSNHSLLRSSTGSMPVKCKHLSKRVLQESLTSILWLRIKSWLNTFSYIMKTIAENSNNLGTTTNGSSLQVSLLETSWKTPSLWTLFPNIMEKNTDFISPGSFSTPRLYQSQHLSG